MNKKTAFLLALVLLIAAAVLPGAACAEGETLTVQTRTSSYTFSVGDTFTYSYWITARLDTDNYSVADVSADAGETAKAAVLLPDNALDSVAGKLSYDPSCLEIESYSTPLLSNTVFTELVKGSLSFVDSAIQSTEEQTYNTNNVLVTVKFKVVAGSSKAVTVGTRLNSLKVNAQIAGKKSNVYYVKSGDVTIPYIAYETVNGETPYYRLNTRTGSITITFYGAGSGLLDRVTPPEGTTAELTGETSDRQQLRFTAQTNSKGAVTFSDIEKGYYDIFCCFTDPATGIRYSTRVDTNTINVSADSDSVTMALQPEDEAYKDIPVTVVWQGDNGYLAARPTRLGIELANNKNIVSEIYAGHTDETVVFYGAQKLDGSGRQIKYRVYATPEDENAPYSYTVEEKDGGFIITAEYNGDGSDLGLIEPDDNGHYWVKQSSGSAAATCTEDGYDLYKCADCGLVRRELIEHTGHAYSGYVFDNNASCTSMGTESMTCALCGDRQTRDIEGTAPGHRFGAYASDNNASCIADATETRTCAVCGEKQSRPIEGTALGHEWGEYTYNNDAGCMTDGTQTRECARCGEKETENAAGTATGHSFGEYVSNNDASCISDGTKTRTCSACGEKETVTDTGTALGHSIPGYVSNNDATEDSDGTKTGTCTRCGETVTVTDEGSALHHIYTDYIYNEDATCTVDGTETAACTEEGCTQQHTRSKTGTALGHAYENYVSNGDAACETDGTETGTCIRCGKTDTRSIPGTALGHAFGTYSSDGNAKCGVDGTKTARCTRCSASDTVPDPGSALSHLVSHWTPNHDGSCIADGTKTGTCTRCGEAVTVADTNSKTPHSFENGFCTVCGAPSGEFDVVFKREEMAGCSVVYVDGVPYPITNYKASLPDGSRKIAVTYTYANSGSSDVHTQYPTGMKVWRLSYAGGKYTAQRLVDFDNIMSYGGTSIRITGVKGIRIITSIPAGLRSTLIDSSLDGYRLEEYGTIVAWDDELGGAALTLENEHAKGNYAFKRGAANSVYSSTSKAVSFTNVLVGFSMEQCAKDLSIRAYMKLTDVSTGESVVIYGGTIHRSIGYVAYQNRNAFAPGTEQYGYIWSIIKGVYGTAYDAEYKG